MIHICASNLKSIAFIFLLFMSLSAGFVINRMTTSLPVHIRGNIKLFSTPVPEESTFLDKTVKVAETLFAGLKKGDNFKLALADAFASLSSYDPEQVLQENLLISKSSKLFSSDYRSRVFVFFPPSFPCSFFRSP